jgi:hypothetical protein
MPNLLILPPAKIWSRGAVVTGTVESTYLAPWLCDGASSRPIRGTGGTHAYTVPFPAAGTVNFCALINASPISVNTVISGGVSTTLLPNALLDDGLRYDSYQYITPVAGVTGVTVTITGNPTTIFAGEFVAGQAFECQRHIRKGGTRSFYAKSSPRDDDFDYLPARDLNAGGRIFSGELIGLSSTAVFDLENWWRGHRGSSLYGCMVPTPSINDCWWGTLTSFAYTKNGPEDFSARIDFRESAKTRWS